MPNTPRGSLLLAAPFLLLPACALRGGVPNGPSAAPSSNVYLRNSFDTDPSIYLGRFIPRNSTDLDEGSAMPLACTQHVTHRFIEGGGVKITETMSVSTEVAARIGVPVVASAQGSGSRTGEVKVEYTLTGKMVAEVADPVAFNECCKAQPDQCTDRFVGEFLQGTGTVYREEARSVDVAGKGTDPQSGVSGRSPGENLLSARPPRRQRCEPGRQMRRLSTCIRCTRHRTLPQQGRRSWTLQDVPACSG